MTPVEWNNLLLSLLNDKLWNDNQSFLHPLWTEIVLSNQQALKKFLVHRVGVTLCNAHKRQDTSTRP